MRKMRIMGTKYLIIIAVAVFPVLAAAGELRVGVISDRPIEMIGYYNPITQYMASRLKEFNITGGKVVVGKDIGEMLLKIRNKDVDIVFETAFTTISMQEKEGMLPKLLVWKKGVKSYRSLFFVRKDSGIRNLDNLRGKVLCFESPDSTSAYAIPKAELIHRGFDVVPLETVGRSGAIRYVFARNDINQAFLVLQKKADAGAFSDNDWNDVPAKAREELRILHETRPVVRFIASFHPSLPGKLQNALIDLLVVMHKDKEGLAALQSAQRISKIERLTDDDFGSLDHVKSLMRFVEQ